MKTIATACLCAASTLFMFSCKQNVVTGSGATATENRNTSSFNAIELDAPVDAVITISNGATPSVQFSGYKNLIDQLKTEIKNNTLRIYTPPGVSFENTKDLKATISIPALWGLSVASASDIQVHGNVTGHDCDIDISGSGAIVVDNINVPKLKTDISGSGNLTINGGTTQNADYEISGSGAVRAFSLQTTTTEASISGSGQADVNVQQSLKADIAGAGDIHYKGNPSITKDISGSGEVSAAN